jgi:hypothetical protein
MGSLNDIVFENRRDDERFTKLTGTIWREAKAMLRELDEGQYYSDKSR